MRNGNSKAELQSLIDQKISSYPTYEEWKQYIKQNRLFIKRSSYPTYEEWKHPKNNIIEFF